MKKILGLLTLFFVVSIFSCKKYLVPKSDNSLIVPSTLMDFEALLDNSFYMNYNMPAMGLSSSDDYFLEKDSYNALSPFERALYKWQPYPYSFPNDWSFAYRAIYNTNICLERIDLVTKDSANINRWNTVKGSALFFRAYHWLELSWEYSKAWDALSGRTDLGIVLRTATNINAPSVRSSVLESYNAIIADTREAAQLLPASQSQSTRPSKAAAYGLLARTFLSMRIYDSALKYSSLALQINSALMDYNDPLQVDLDATTPFQNLNLETIFSSGTNNFYATFNPQYSNAFIDTTLYSEYNNNDLRRRAYFQPNGSLVSFKGTYSATINSLFSGIAVDELILITAECLARAGDRDGALSYLNTLLEKRYLVGTFMPVTAGTSAEALLKILQERRKELLYRGNLRWSDIKRLNKENAAISLTRMIDGQIYTLQPNDKRFALQLPDDVIRLSGMPQN